MKKMRTGPFLIMFLSGIFCLCFGQISQECQGGIGLWDRVVGTVVGPIFHPQDDCVYEVEHWDEPNFLEINVTSLLRSPDVPPVLDFNLVGFANRLHMKTAAGFRPLEIVSESGEVFAAIELNWVTNEAGETQIGVHGFCLSPSPEFGAPSSLEFAYLEVVEDGSPLRFQLLWKPSDSFVRNGWIELYVNDSSAGRMAIHIPKEDPSAPAHVRYGSTKVPDFLPTGTFYCKPINPTPNNFNF